MNHDLPSGLTLIKRPRQVEASLWRRLRFEDQTDCRETIFRNYTTLARGIARFEFRRRPAYGLERGDFEQLAFGGLLEAIDRFDPLRGAAFSTFAKPRIRGAITDGLARSSEIAAQYSQRRRVERERLRSVSGGGSQPLQDHVAELSNVAIGLALGLIIEQSAFSETINEASSINGYHSLDWQELQHSVLREIERLPNKERVVLQQHYLFDVSFKLIAEMLGISKGRVSQIHRAALEKLRLHLRLTE